MEKLLKGVEIKWNKLGEIGQFVYGYAAKAQDSGDARFIRITDINMNGKLIPTDAKFVDISEENERFILKKNDLLMARTGATYGKTMIFEEDYPAIFAGFLIKLSFDKKIINPKYYWHFSQSELFWRQANKLVSGGGQPQFNANAVREVKIPIPPLEVQEEIVRILDAFTKLTAELTAELTARKKQYEYYRDRLLTFGEGEVDWKTLGEVGEFTRGKRFVKTDMLSEGFPCIHYGEMYTHYNIWAEKTKSFVSHDLASKLRVADHGDVIIVAAGETIEDIGKGTAWLGNSGVVIHDACFSYRSSLNPKYVSYFLRTKHFHDQIKKYISSGKISAINANGLSKAKIPIPALEDQARLVSILDKFDVLTSSITEGLPREIELRQKQYEYYRNLLLSFPKEEVKA